MTHAKCLNLLDSDKVLNQVNLMARLEAQGTFCNSDGRKKKAIKIHPT